MTNFSTGRLGTELANSLTDRGHEVTLLIGQQATYRGQSRAHQVQTFTTTENLREQLRTLTDKPIQAVFHAAAVNDFSFGKVWRRSLQGELKEIKSGKFSTREGTLLAELIPTPKLIAELRQWFPKAKLVGWKYEVEGNRQSVIRAAEKQLAECLTDACVANGPGYGAGFGFVRGDEEPMHAADAPALFALLESFVRE